MVHITLSKNFHRLSKEVGPVFLILILSMAMSIFIILYPSLTVFSIFHSYFVQKKARDFSKRLLVKKGSLPDEEK
jgi:hypothetical protein